MSNTIICAPCLSCLVQEIADSPQPDNPDMAQPDTAVLYPATLEVL